MAGGESDDSSGSYTGWPTIMEESLNPPAHATAATATPTPWVLLDLQAFMANHPNATTAKSQTRSGQPIEVSFWTAPPPSVSYMCVHCPGLDPTKFAAEPTIMATEADLVLLRLALGPWDNRYDGSCYDYFVYHSAATKLRLLPHPAIDRFIDNEVGLLRCGSATPSRRLDPRRLGLHPHPVPDDGTFVVAALCNTHTSGFFEYALHVYHSGADAWSCHPLSLHGLVDPSFTHVNTKAITVGGKAGTMGWVDLYRGIIFCDILSLHTDTSSPALRYFPLPPPLKPTMPFSGSARPLRDIAVVQGRIRYTQMQVFTRRTCSNGTFSRGWTATIWSAPATNPWKQGWRQDYKLNSSDLSVDGNTLNFELLPKILDDQATPQQTLERLYVGHPTLSLHSDDTVCFMAKVDQWNEITWVLAVDVKNMRLKDVALYGSKRIICFGYGYMSSKISDYLPMAPGLKGSLKRQGVVLTVPSQKKQTHMVHLSPPSWKGGDQQNFGTSMGGTEDIMDLDIFFG
ncbi:uncharacterized protein LOC102715238 [Oryza brachyantha]|uniref:uncharacterized protein LOC102715238 n=1 Tax=Oryza brachyantha TaxID=4533 RepID=UPI001ADBBB89|nr:uncharacterized protein LOC102715238 [Oryza brachyantha]